MTFSVTGEEVVRLLELARAEFDGAPIALFFDNGPETIHAVVAASCDRHGVLIVRSVPHTPQHNPWVERHIGEVRIVSGLDPWSETESLEDAQRRLLDVVLLLDEHLVRRVLGNKTALEAGTQAAVKYAPADRARLARRVAIAREEARRQLGEHLPSGAVRRADRNAALDVLEDLDLITKTIGGKPSVRARRRAKAYERTWDASDVAPAIAIERTDESPRLVASRPAAALEDAS